jgi:hypothetical protein
MLAVIGVCCFLAGSAHAAPAAAIAKAKEMALKF